MAATITHYCFLLLALLMLLSGGDCTTITITNRCPYTVWPATQPNSGSPQLSTTGFELPSQASNSVTASAPWSGRFWGRSGCSNSGTFSCATADCASGQVSCNGAGGIPPATLVEISVQNTDKDYYDVSNVDGFNLPVSVTPQGGSGDCRSSSCPANVNDGCPDNMAVRGSDGSIIACRNANPGYFKLKCPDAYSYPKDDPTSTFTCIKPSGYQITFCP